MHPLHYALALLCLAVLSFTSHVAADSAPSPGSPGAVVQALYSACLAHSTGFNAESVKLTMPYLAPDLYARILKKLNQPTPKGDAPDIEGDIFLDAQEPPTSFSIGRTIDRKVSMGPGQAWVDVILKWPNEKRIYTVYLVQFNGAWEVANVDFVKDGTLSDLLK